jgi:hypothetical protein
MNNNHLITQQYISDFAGQYSPCADLIQKAVNLLLRGETKQAQQFFNDHEDIRYKKGDKVPQHYKQKGQLVQTFSVEKKTHPNVNERDKFMTFRKDHYHCSYTGIKLINHPLIELLSYILPEHFPYNNPPHGSDAGIKNTHLLVWVLWPSVDHILPVSRGGLNHPENYTTSNSKFNMFKNNFRNEELGLQCREPEDKTWNGLEEEYHQLFTKYRHLIPQGRHEKFEAWNRIMRY